MAQRYKHKLILAGVLLGYFAIVYALQYYTHITCVFLHLLHIPCPGCGMTRALICLLRLDFSGAWRYNPLIFAMPYVLAYLFCDWKSRVHKYILLIIGIGAILNWGINILRILL